MLCKRLGVRYSARQLSPKRTRRPLKPPTSSAPPEEAAPGEHPRLLRKWAQTNADFLSRHGWRKLAKSRRGRSEISELVRNVPHDASAYLDYLHRCGAPVAMSGRPLTPAELQLAVDRGPHQSAKLEADFLLEEVYKMC